MDVTYCVSDHRLINIILFKQLDLFTIIEQKRQFCKKMLENNDALLPTEQSNLSSINIFNINTKLLTQAFTWMSHIVCQIID